MKHVVALTGIAGVILFAFTRCSPIATSWDKNSLNNPPTTSSVGGSTTTPTLMSLATGFKGLSGTTPLKSVNDEIRIALRVVVLAQGEKNQSGTESPQLTLKSNKLDEFHETGKMTLQSGIRDDNLPKTLSLETTFSAQERDLIDLTKVSADLIKKQGVWSIELSEPENDGSLNDSSRSQTQKTMCQVDQQEECEETVRPVTIREFVKTIRFYSN